MVFEGLAENNTQQQTKILENNTTYWWSIRSLNDDGNSDWSVPWRFTTVITAPTLVSPADNSIDLKTIQDFVWNPDTAATAYHLQVSKDAGFTDLVFNDSTLTSVTFDNAMLDYYQRYYWRVRKYVGDVPGLWSEVWKLTTGIGKVVLISPDNNSQDLGNDIVFIWQNLKGADEYQFQLSEQQDFAVLVSNVTTTDTRHEIISLDYDKSYYFRVKGKYADGEGEWSDIFTFRTKVYSGVDEIPVAGLTGFEIYPNPFSSSLSIGLTLNKDADIRLQITGLNGETIGEIYTGSLAWGTYNFSYNPANLTQGAYLITLFVNGKSVTKQVVLIK